MIGVQPRVLHGRADAKEKAFVVAVEKVFYSRRDLDFEELQVVVEEDEYRKEAVGLGAEGTRVEAEGGAFAGPEDGAADCNLPAERAEVILGTAVAD